MIGEQSKVKQFFNSDISLIENYLLEGCNRGYGRPSWNSKKNISNII